MSAHWDFGRVSYPLRDGYQVTFEQNFSSGSGGPTRLIIEPAEEWPQEDDDGEVHYGPYAGDGIQQTHLRAIPLRQARKDLEDQRLEILGSRLARKIPEDFTRAGNYGLARLASVYVMLCKQGVRNPVAVIARACQPHTHGTWAARVRRAREAGYLLGTERGSEDEPRLSPSAVVVLEMFDAEH